MMDSILLLRPLCQDFVEEEYCIERISVANYYEIKVLLKLNSFIFYLINFEKQCNAPLLIYSDYLY